MNEWTAEYFRNVLWQDFMIQLADETSYIITLTEVNDLGEPGEEGLRKPFSILFRNPDRQHYLPQRTYRLVHPHLGGMDLFLVPLGADAEGMRYEAVFG
jgi:hypothetical protein